jgi:3-deoxy-D-manno-octulosonic-acid transferase
VTARAYALAGADPARATPPNAASAPIKPGLLLKTYGGLTSAVRPLVGPLLRHREQKGKEDGARLMERRGVASLARPSGPLVWVHAASVGETNAVMPLIAALRAARPDVKVLLTTTTVTSARLALDRLPPGTLHQYVPFDAPSYAAAFLDHWRPDMVLFTESEIWPSLILAIAERRIPLGLVNARMSPKSYKSWQRLSGISGPLFSRFNVILAQNEKLARWFRDVGGRVVIPVGNLKADAPPPPVDAIKQAAMLRALGERPRLLAASTHDGEEVMIAEAHALLAAQYPNFCTLIAPRHPQRGPLIAAELGALGLRIALRSRDEPLTDETQVYIADTIGELGTLFASVPVAFMGGSLIDRGGQNPLEAVSHGAAVLTGPSVHNFRDEYRALEAAGGSRTVQDGAALAAKVLELMREPAQRETMVAAARDSADRLRGALARTLATVLPLLPPAPVEIAPDADVTAQPLSFKNAS